MLVRGCGDYVHRFDWTDYFLIIAAAGMTLGYQIFRQISLTYDNASRVSIYTYSQSIIQFSIDCISGYKFNAWEYGGFGFLLFINCSMVTRTIFTPPKKT